MICKTQVAWTTFEVRELRRLTQNEKMSACRIFKAHFLPRHTEYAISTKMRELSLGDPQVAARIKFARRLSPPGREKLIQFLQTQGRLMPSSDTAEKFGIRRAVVTYYRLKLGLRLSDNIRFTSRRFRKSRQAVMPAFRQGLREYWQWFWHRRRDKMYRMLEKDAMQNGISAFFECKSCNEHWPNSSRYFYFRKRCNGERTLRPQCRACGK